MKMANRHEIQWDWCERVTRLPVEVVEQADGRFRMWGYIEEVNRYLRIVTLDDRETLDNAFFDRRYKGPKP